MRIAIIAAACLPYEHPEDYLIGEVTEIISDGYLVIPLQLIRYAEQNRIPIVNLRSLGLYREGMTEREIDLAILHAADQIYAFRDSFFGLSDYLINYCMENDLPIIIYQRKGTPD